MLESGWGEHFERLLRRSGKSKAQVAADCGVHPNSVSAWKAGSQPRPRMMARIADSLGVSEAELLGREEVPGLVPRETVPEIVEQARRRIATVMRVPLEKIKLTLIYET